MGTKTGVGVSKERNPAKAGQEAAQKALENGGIIKPSFVLTFATVGYPQEPVVKAIHKTTGDAPLIGGSGEGIIAQGVANESNFGVVVMALESDEIKVTHGMATGLKDDSEAAGRKLAEALQQSGDVADGKMMLVATDGLTTNWDKLVAGIQGNLKTNQFLSIVGGFTGDNMQFKQTYQYLDGNVTSDAVVGAVLSGDFKVSTQVNSGCVPVGMPHKITKAEGNLIYEIDGKKATDVLRTYCTPEDFDNWATSAVLVLSLAFRASGDLQKSVDDFIIRYIPAKDAEAGTITLPTEISTGTEMWLTRRDPEKIAAGIDKACKLMAADLGGAKPKVVFQFDCAGRGKWLLVEEEKQKMLGHLQSQMGADLPWIGLYTYGEIGPVEGNNYFHNYTVVLSALY